MHARVAYLSLNRGEGGQNIIGTELFDALGVIRTEELLQARRLDGGEQFFTRTFDYGFSKTRAEAAAKWNEREVLGDMVRVIRTFRPLVIYSRFQGTPADGHGHHQFAGYLSPLAFKAAADPNEFPEQLKEGLRPWQAKKLYRGVGFRPDPANPPTTLVQTGIFDPVLGRTFGEIAAEGRSQHKSQAMGAIEPRGPQASGMRLLESAVQTATPEASALRRPRRVDTGPRGARRTACGHAACRARRDRRGRETGVERLRAARAQRPSSPRLPRDCAPRAPRVRRSRRDQRPLVPVPRRTSCCRSRSAISRRRSRSPPASWSIRLPTTRRSCREARSA